MKATTHTEIYRRYSGELRSRPAVERILGWAGLRMAFRRKLPALILFTPSAITALVGCVMVHLRFMLAERTAEVEGRAATMAARGIQELLGDTAENIHRFIQTEQFFALLTLAWYGSHLIAEDRRLSANLLYFARPITPLRYILGKWLTALALGSLTLMVPALMICWQAAFSSPDWIFLKESSWVIWRTIGFCALWIVVMSSLVLAISSAFQRKGLALMCTFALVFLVQGISLVIVQVTGNPNYGLLSLIENFQAISEWLFHKPNLGTSILRQAQGLGHQPAWNIEGSFWTLGLITFLSWVVLWRNVKRMEVIA